VYIHLCAKFYSCTQTRASGYPFLLVQLEAPSAWRTSGESLSFVDNVDGIAVSSSAFPLSCTFAGADFTRETRKNGEKRGRSTSNECSTVVVHRPVINLYLPTRASVFAANRSRPSRHAKPTPHGNATRDEKGSPCVVGPPRWKL